MCVVSNIGDYYKDRWPELPKKQEWERWPILPKSGELTLPVGPIITVEQIQEARELVRQLQGFKNLVQAAEQVDKAMGEADCERADVKDFMRQCLERLDGLEKRIRQLEGLE